MLACAHTFLCLAFVLISICSYANAGVACFPACTVACCETAGGPAAFAGPLGIVVGVTGCTGICMVACAAGGAFVPPACFANDTSISVYNNMNGNVEARLISAVQPKDKVVTLVGGKQHLTTVVKNTKATGHFEFFEISLSHEDSPLSFTTLKVTPNHGMVEVNPDGQLTLTTPKDLQVGKSLMTTEGTMRIQNIKHLVDNERFTLVTDEGTVLASNIFVTTMCEEFVTTGMCLRNALDEWKTVHKYHVASIAVDSVSF